MASDNTPSRKISTTETVFDIIEAVQELDGANGSEIADHVDLAPSTVSDHLTTLESMKYIVKRKNGYQLGLRFLGHGIHARDQYEGLKKAQPLISEVAEETAETVWLFVEEHDRVVAIFREEGGHGLHVSWRGKFLPMHCTSTGKAILASYPESHVHRVLDKQGLPQMTDRTITDRDKLFTELEKIRNKGFALNDGEANENVRGISSPIEVSDNVLGAITVGGYRYRITDDRFRETIPKRLLGITNEIEFKLAEHDFSDLVE